MVRNVDNAAVITAPQQISQRTMATLERQVDDAIAQRAAAVHIYLAATQSIDSAGLNWLVNTHNRLTVAEIPLRLVEVPAIISDIFLATRLDTRLTIVPCNGAGEKNHA